MRVDRSKRRLLGAAAGGWLLTVTPIAQASPALSSLVAVRVWPADAYTRVTLESTLPLQYMHFHLTDPDRLVLDISGMRINHVLETLPNKILQRDPYIRQVRIAQKDAETIRLVFDLKNPVNPQIFTLKPIADFQNRLVIDLYPARVSGEDDDPLLGLLQDYSRNQLADRLPAQTLPEHDVLGEKIDEILFQTLLANKKTTQPTAPVVEAPVTLNKPPIHKQRRVVVVLDPGHGGEDPGAVGKGGLKEKDVVLQIARQAKRYLEQAGYKVHMTRNEDVFIPLRIRVRMAQKLKADAFISIHADSFTRASARGTGVYVLSAKGAVTSDAAKYLAKTQNAADEIGGVPVVGNPLVDRTILDLTQTATTKDSLKMGSLVLKELGKVNKLHKGYVDRAAFVVLKAPEIPSILVESAFLSNPVEAKLLAGKTFRGKVAQAISRGVDAYFRQGAVLARRL